MQDNLDVSQSWEKMVEDMASGKLPIMDFMKVAHQNSEKENYFEYVQRTRAFMVLMQDKRILLRLIDEMTQIGQKEDSKFSLGVKKITETVRSKDGFRRFEKLVALRSEVFSDSASLLSGKNFEECLAQYQEVIAYVEGLWADSCNLYMRKHYPLATFTAILTIEEIGKLGRLWQDLLGYDHVSKPSDKQKPIKDHRKKHFIGVVSGAVNNARLDRILGIKKIRKLLEDTESGKLEELRQSCLYLDIKGGRIVMPAEIITDEIAKFFTVLAGELMAEILGHFPWEFQRMIEAVISYETEIGYDYEFVKQGGKADS